MCILLVEDEWLIRTIMGEELEDAGFSVIAAETGDEALQLLGALETSFDVLVTDIHMPGQTDGICLARIVRERFPRMPIIYTTGRPDALDRAGLPGGRVLTLVKPYKPSRLIEAVRSAFLAGAALPRGA
ncbi:response regulator [Acidisoma sp.]|uniref:response regulator n=1 Tax=Acidisoma sp. TaxID=1872115 RepID=UPI003B0085F7